MTVQQIYKPSKVYLLKIVVFCSYLLAFNIGASQNNCVSTYQVLDKAQNFISTNEYKKSLLIFKFSQNTSVDNLIEIINSNLPSYYHIEVFCLKTGNLSNTPSDKSLDEIHLTRLNKYSAILVESNNDKIVDTKNIYYFTANKLHDYLIQSDLDYYLNEDLKSK